MIKAAICGYGNLGKGVEAAMNESRDIQLTAIFTRRGPETVKPVRDGVKVYSYADLPGSGAASTWSSTAAEALPTCR